MNLNAALAKSVLMSASIGLIVPVLIPTARAAAPANRVARPGEPAAEEEGTIEGVAIARGDGRWLGLTMDGTSFRIAFYNERKRPIAADRPNGNVRWIPSGRSPERGVLVKASDGQSLVGNRPVRKPWVFKVFVTLLDDAGSAVETYTVDYPGPS